MSAKYPIWSKEYFTNRILRYSVLVAAVLLMSWKTASATESVDNIDWHPGLAEHIQLLPSVANEGQHTLPATAFDDRVVVVTFFASWCPPCLDEFEALNFVSRQLSADSITVVALNVFEEFDDNDDVRMNRFLQHTQPEFPVLKGNDESIELFGGVNRIPTLFVFDRSGKLAYSFVHKRGALKQSVDAVELLEALRPLI